MKRIIIACLLVLIVPLAAQTVQVTNERGTLTLVDSVPLVDLGLYQSTVPEIAPDGSKLAWISLNDVCVLVIDTVERTCTPLDVEDVLYERSIRWAWDSTTLAVLGRDAIYRFDTATQIFTATANDPDAFETAVVWARDGSLYFLRDFLDDTPERNRKLSLYHLPAGTMVAEHVYTFTEDYTEYGTFYPLNERHSISPDGRYMAFTTSYIDDDTPSTLWLLALDGSPDPLNPVLPVGEILINGMPDWQTTEGWLESTTVMGVGWSADSRQVAVVLDNGLYQIRGIFPVAYLVDIDTGTVTPWMDYTNVPDYSTFFFTEVENDDDIYTFFDRHEGVVYLPEQAMMLYSNRAPEYDLRGLSVITAPGAPPVRLDVWESYHMFDNGLYNFNSYGVDGDTIRVVVGEHLLTFEVSQPAS